MHARPGTHHPHVVQKHYSKLRENSCTISKLLMRKPSKRFWSILIVAVVCCYAGFLVFVGWAMRQRPETFGRIMSRVPMLAMLMFPFETMWTRARAGSVVVGDNAPDFTLPTLDHKSRVELASFRGKQPVVLVFGSYT